MAKKNAILSFDPDTLLSDAVKEINKEKYSVHKPLDIINFAEKFTKKKLYPAQEIVLKWFYAGSKHNEDLEITDNDIEIIKTWDIDQPWLWEGENSKYELLKKYKNDPERFFTDLVLVLGRRAGKSFMTALIATYEAYKLICIPDPQEYYGISANIWIINTASTKEQANTEIFDEIRKFISNCPVFDGRIGHDIDGYMWLRTDADLERNKRIEKYGGKPVKGSIIVAAGSSNSKGLRGHTAVMCLEPDTLISTENGLVRISDKKIKKENIFGLSGKRMTDDVIESKKDLYSLVLSNKKEILCTKDHKIFVLNEDLSFGYKKVSDINIEKDIIFLNKNNEFGKNNYKFNYDNNKVINKEKCKICKKNFFQITDNHIKSHGITFSQYIQKYGPTNNKFCVSRDRQKYITIPEEMNKDFAYILGLLYSEGCVDCRNRIGFSITDQDIAELYCEKIKKVFNQKINIRKVIKKRHKYIYECNFMSKKICNFFIDNGIILNCGAKNKKIPDCIIQSSEEVVVEFLRGCFEGDGVQSKGEVSYTSSSFRLVKDISVLLQYLGIQSSFTKSKNKNGEYQYKVCMYSEDKDLFYSKIGFYSERRKSYKHKNRKVVQDRFFVLPQLYYEKLYTLLYSYDVGDKWKETKNNIISCLRSIKSKKQKGISKKGFKSSIKMILEVFPEKDIQYFIDLNKIVSNYWLMTVNSLEISEKNHMVYDLNFYGEDHSFFADGVLNHNCIYDELAHFVEGESSSKSTSEEVYTALAPSCLTLSHMGEGRNIAISSPDLAQGFFHKHYNDAKDNEGFLLFQIPTWNANPLYPRDGQYISNAYKKDFERANAEYGARFRQAAGNAFFPHDKIDDAFNSRDEWYKHKRGIPGYQYYMHLDPASSGDRYAIMICHPETRYCPATKSHQTYIIEDFSDFFVPPPGGYLDPDEIVDEHIFPLFERFRIVSVTYDSMFSLEQQKKFNRKGIVHRKISFAGKNKNELYQTALDYFINDRIVLCRDDDQLRGELKAVLINYKKVPPKIMKNEAAEFNTDDLVDCLCGLIHSVSTGGSGHTKLPRVSTVRTGLR